MRHIKLALALLTTAVLSACGGGNGPKAGDQTPKLKYSALVTFGDSLSDVGTYAVGPIAKLGGGTFSINGNNTAKDPVMTGKNWTELVAAQLGLPKPCPAQTGLDSTDPVFTVPVVFNSSCLNYAQGGSRVTNPVGKGHKATGSTSGATTVPVSTQIANHLKVAGGKFKGDELVTVMAGGNDVLMLLGGLDAAATAAGTAAGKTAFGTSLTGQLAAGATNPLTAAQAIGLAIQTEAARAGSTDQTIVAAAVTAAAQQPGNAAVASAAVYGPMVAKAQADASAAGAKAGQDYFAANAPKLVADMGKAGAETAALVKTQIIANGANYVVVNNLPDVAGTPAGKSKSAAVQDLIKNMVNAYNDQLKSGVASEAKVLLVDLYTISRDQAANPGPYGLTNTTTPACDLTKTGGSSLLCTGNTLIAGDVGHYMYADDIHPTPFEYSLIARYVLEQMAVKGWI